MPTEIRVLKEADRPALERFLQGRPESMALRGYVAKDGVAPPYGVYAGALEGGELVSVLGFMAGTLHLVAPRALEGLLGLAGRSGRGNVAGLNGPADQVERALAWLDAADARTVIRARDELFTLKLRELKEPASLKREGLRCREATLEDAALQGDWRHDFWVENLGAPAGEKLRAQCGKLVEDEIALGALHVLEDGGRPVSTAAFAPALPDAVQVANVFTPPDLRGRGYAQAVTALSLLGARARGVELGVLFTGVANAPAQRAYRALGFAPCGELIMLVLAEPRLCVPGG